MTDVVQVFTGSDAVLLDDAVRVAVKAALGDESPDFALAELDEANYLVDDTYSIAPLVDAAQTPPMLTDRRVVVGRHLARFSTGDSVEPLIGYLANPLETTRLILVWSRGPALNKRTAGLPKKLTEALKAMGVTVTKTDVAGKQAASFIEASFRDRGLKLDRAAKAMLVDHLGDEVNRVGGIVTALVATYGAGATLGVDQIAPYVGSAGDVPPWDLTDAIADGNISASLAVCRRMVHGGERHPLAILSSLTNHYARMAQLDGAPVSGERDAAAYLGVKGSTYPVKKAMAQARRMGPGNVKAAWGLLAAADLDLRGTTGTSAEQTLEILIARLARL